MPRYTSASYNEESGILEVSTACNPCIYIPETDTMVFGDESWWGRIEPGDDISDITDKIINRQWYMKFFEKLRQQEATKEPKEGKENKMTRKECIRDLKGSMELYLFDPGTGEILQPEQLNDTDRITYEAMKAAVGFHQGDQEERETQEEMHRFFYTFGTDSVYPYGEHDFVEVRAKTEQEADEKYRESFPDRQPGSDILNCAFVYTEDKWIGDGKNGIRDRFYRDREAARIIE